MRKSILIEYDGFKWCRYPESKRRSDRVYYKRNRTGENPQWLHRYIWEKANGEIPEGYHIHHKDGNPENNVLENLECVSAKEHKKSHPMDEERYQRQLLHLERIREKTKAWHRSPEGIAKHREIGGLAYKSFVPQEKTCQRCGKPFLTRQAGHQDKFCSNACKSAWRREQGLDDVELVCEWCGKTFIANKYGKRRFCGKTCSARYTAQLKSEKGL